MTLNPLEAWHHIVVTQDPSGLQALLADDVVFHSPVVHTPQRGKEITTRYLEAALQVFFSPSFRVVRKLFGEADAMLEFESEVDGVTINAVASHLPPSNVAEVTYRWHCLDRLAKFLHGWKDPTVIGGT